MSNNSFSTGTWIVIIAIAGLAAFFVVWQFFPQIIEQAAAGIVAFFAFLIGLVFRKKRKGS